MTSRWDGASWLDKFTSVFDRRHELKPLTRALSVSVLNQVVSSGTNFMLGVYLVRVLTPADFGLYGIGFAASLFVATIGNGLLLTQMVVNAPDKSPEVRGEYAGRMLLATFGYCIALAVTAATLLIAGSIWSPQVGDYAHFGLAITVASIAYLTKEFFVRDAYIQCNEGRALKIHITLAASTAAMLATVHAAGVTVTAEVALWVYALAHVLASLSGFWVSKLVLAGADWRLMKADIKETWLGGRWSIPSTIFYFLRTQSHIIIVAGTSGPAGVAALNAARLFMTPAALLTPALSQVFLPKLARMRVESKKDVAGTGRLFSLAVSAVVLMYSGVVLYAFDAVSPFVLGDRYGNSLFWLAAGWAIYVLVLALRNGQELTLQAMKGFRYQAVASLLSGAITIAAVATLVGRYSEIGAILGLILGEIALVLIFALRSRRGEQ